MRRSIALLVFAAMLFALSSTLFSADAPKDATKPGAPARTITVKMVTDFETAKPVSDLEAFHPVTTTIFQTGGSKEITLGERSVLWVRNAHIDGKFFFERYYQEKYIGRKAVLDIDSAQLGAGEHVLQPGNHKFTLTADGILKSDDPTIRVDGSMLLLKMHPVTVYAVDGGKTGPADFRIQPADVGLLSLDADFRLDAKTLPDPKALFEPRTPPDKGKPTPPLMNVLSHQKQFYPLTVWLPANQVGQGYVLYPSWQTFHLKPDGKVELSAAGAPRIAGIEVDGATVLIPQRKFSGKNSTRTGMTAGVGAVTLGPAMNFGATLAPVKFQAGIGAKPPEDFFLPVDNDLTRSPHKFFVADNTTADKDAVRLMALEWQKPVFARGEEARVSLRFLETTNKQTLKKPEVRMSWSSYSPSNPLARVWQPLPVLGWSNGKEAGELRFKAPEVPFSFVVFRVQIIDAASPAGETPFTGEITGCVIDPKQQGTASFITNKGRNAFVAGEDIELSLVFRSKNARTSGSRNVTLTHPDGHVETLAVEDKGEPWFAQSMRLPAARTVNLAPGAYTLTVRELPAEIVSVPFTFELAGRQKPSLYHIVKPSKYTRPMNELESSHLQGKPIDLDRAVHTFADLGYTRLDLMSYMTNHHLRAYTWREELAAEDERLPAPESVYTPAARDQILNACVRNQLQYADVWLSYGDFELPRYIEGYIRASERWMARDMLALRHSPALDGMILYDEMYQKAAVGFVKEHHTLFPKIRARVAEDQLGLPPSKIEETFNRYLQRPRSQRDPKALDTYLKYVDWQAKGWSDYINRVVKVGREVAPHARFGTYHRTWLLPGSNDEIYNGYPPDLFKNLDIIGHIHYADNSTAWVSIPLLAQALRTGKDKTLYVNMPLSHEGRTEWDGQYQRHMAFAQLAQGANGVSFWGLPHTFEDGPNPGTMQARDTTGPLNRDVLMPFGEIIDQTSNGYRKIGIVSTFNQHALGPQKTLPTGHQTEGIWIACWRLGYPAVFVREEHMQQKLEGFSVLFVPGIRYDGELDENMLKRLREAIAAGTKVVVEGDSILDLPGIIKLSDWTLNSYYLGDNYFPTWLDDELLKTYEKSQPIVDYLRPKLKEWNVQPAATGPFTVGPSWRDGGQIQYLVMANFEDPAYTHAVKQQMAKPVLMPLHVPAHRGKVAYDLLAQKELELKPAPEELGHERRALTLDMLRMQGALVAFLPERIGKLQVRHAVNTNPGRMRLQGTLLGESGKPLDAVFPVKVTLTSGAGSRVFYRVLGRDLQFELDLPQGSKPPTYRIELRESISGQTASLEVQGRALAGPSLELEPNDTPYVPNPPEVKSFLKTVKKAVIVPSKAIPGMPELAQDLQRRLKAAGIATRIADEASVYRQPTGNLKEEDPYADGFHSWHSGQEIISPAVVVDEDVILLGGRNSSFLIDVLADIGYLSVAPVGGPGKPIRPSIQVARKGFHYAHDVLCLIANDAPSMKRTIERLLGDLPVPAPLPVATYTVEKRTDSEKATPITPATAALGTNELVMDLQFDKAGNLYVITWGHGKNLYSLTPDGKNRFSRLLPEMGTNRLSVHEDRLYAYTAAGARLYRLSLDNQPSAQARLNLDPGHTKSDDQYALSHIDYLYLPAKKLLLHNQPERLRLLDDQFHIVAEWRGETFQDKDVSDETHHRMLHGYVLSPDQQRIAQLETSFYFTKSGYQDVEVHDTHLVVRDLTGKLLHEYKNLDNGRDVEARLIWPAEAPGPVIYIKEPRRPQAPERDERWSFAADLKVLSRTSINKPMFVLGEERFLIPENRVLLYFDRFDHEQCRLGPFNVMPTFAQTSPDLATIALLDEYGTLSLYNTKDGSLRKQFAVPERGKVLRFSPDSQRILLGGFRGSILTYDLDGVLLWQTRLGDFNDILDQELPLYDPAFPDFTEKLWPVSRDAPGELDKLVRMDVNRLVNGDFESAGGWQGPVAIHNEGYQSPHSLKVGKDMIGQEVKGFLGQHVTWVLEFFYRSAPGKDGAELLAGLMADSEYPDSVARHFRVNGDWRFGRVVIKNGSNCKALRVGFAASNGEVLVDQVQLRRIRFPSINHMLYEPFHPVKPVMLENQLFATKYHPFGALKEQATNKVFIQNTSGGAIPQVDSGFMQNGRLNDVTSQWYNQPVSRDADPIISLGLKEARWISMVALYFNAYDEANITPHIDILATDLAAKQDRLVASVRHNGQIMRLVKFPPIKTSLIKIRLVNSIARLRTITEIELYGPLSGREGTPGFEDPDGQNTYMGDFSRVDQRPRKLADSYQPAVTKAGTNSEEIYWNAPLAQVLISKDQFYIARTFGKTTAHTLAEPTKDLYWSRVCGMGFTPYGTLYGGLLLRCGNDGKLYCLNPETGTELWAVPLGERLFGCPVAIQEDVFLANDKGKLFQIDLASGGILKEVPIPGAVFSSPATDGKHLFFITDEGLLVAYRAVDLALIWKVPIAKFTDSTPAVSDGVVYLADQEGTAYAVSVADGKVLWKTELDDEFTRCPVVGPDRVIFGCREGTLAVLNRADGKIVWKKKVESRFDYEPVLLEDRLVFFRKNKAMLAQLADGTETPFEYVVPVKNNPKAPSRPLTLTHDPIVSISFYKGGLFFIDRPGENQHNALQVNMPWHVNGGSYTVLIPAPMEATSPNEKEKK